MTPAWLVYARSRSIAVCAPAVAGQGVSCQTHVAVRVCRPCLIGIPPRRIGSPMTSSIPLPVKLGAVYGLPLPAAVSASIDGAEAPFGVVAVADQVL